MKIKILFIALCFTQLSLASFLRDTARGVSRSKRIYAEIMIQPQGKNVSLTFTSGSYESCAIVEFFILQSNGKTKHDISLLPGSQDTHAVVLEYERCMRLASAVLKPKHKNDQSIFVEILDDQTAQIIERKTHAIN